MSKSSSNDECQVFRIKCVSRLAVAVRWGLLKSASRNSRRVKYFVRWMSIWRSESDSEGVEGVRLRVSPWKDDFVGEVEIGVNCPFAGI